MRIYIFQMQIYLYIYTFRPPQRCPNIWTLDARSSECRIYSSLYPGRELLRQKGMTEISNQASSYWIFSLHCIVLVSYVSLTATLFCSPCLPFFLPGGLTISNDLLESLAFSHCWLCSHQRDACSERFVLLITGDHTLTQMKSWGIAVLAGIVG